MSGNKKTLRKDELTPKQQLFVREYLIDQNATAAAVRAGFSARSARGKGPFLLTLPPVAAAIQRAIDRRAERIGVTAERVLIELCRIGFANIEDYTTLDQATGLRVADFTRCDRDQLAAVQEITVEDVNLGAGESARVGQRCRLKLHSKREALLDIGKHLGMWGKGPRPQQVPGAGQTEAADNAVQRDLTARDRALLEALEKTRQPKPPAPAGSNGSGGTVH